MSNQKPETRSQKKKGLIFVVSGPSGSGKTTLLKKLFKAEGLKHKLVRSISFSTRPKRPGEKEGKDYFFISQDEFLKKRRGKKLLEWTKYLDYYYATPRDFIDQQLNKGKHIVLCLDLNGVLKIKQLYPKNTVTIFIKPPSLKELGERIRGRCRSTKKEEIHRRMNLAKRELGTTRVYKYSLLNQDLTRVIGELKDIVLKELSAH